MQFNWKDTLVWLLKEKDVNEVLVRRNPENPYMPVVLPSWPLSGLPEIELPDDLAKEFGEMENQPGTFFLCPVDGLDNFEFTIPEINMRRLEMGYL
jgi:hypothetical protein